MDIKKFVILGALRISAIWDLLTTFVGTLFILGKVGFIPIGISLVTMLIAGAFNFSTLVIWRSRQSDQAQFILLRIIWVMAIILDFSTSLLCNALFLSPTTFPLGKGAVQLPQVLAGLNFSQFFVVFFVTTMCSCGPMLVGYLREQDFN